MTIAETEPKIISMQSLPIQTIEIITETTSTLNVTKVEDALKSYRFLYRDLNTILTLALSVTIVYY
tara:strand:- start:106 stop:303 length:198 start_codon:yes stop_codon:yes gene_type:complete